MPLDPRAKRFLDTLAASGAANTLALTVEQRRRSLAQLLSFAGPLPTVGGVEERTFPRPASSLRVRIYAPAGVGAHEVLPGLVYFHGGGLVAGSLETHAGICRALAAASRCRLLSVDYRLAPEHSFPAAIDDGLAATWWVATHAAELGLDPDRLGVCGDSAGATLAAVVCQSAAALGQPRLAWQFLLCPIMAYAARRGGGLRRTAAGGGGQDHLPLPPRYDSSLLWPGCAHSLCRRRLRAHGRGCALPDCEAGEDDDPGGERTRR